MMGYRDMTFCDYKDCKKFKDNTCGKALNAEVIKGSKKWWGKSNGEPPIITFAEHPECWSENE